MTDEREDKISGSGINRIADCAGSYQLEKQFPKEESSAAADMGTRIHDWIATGKGNLTDEERHIGSLCIQYHKEIIDTINAGDVTHVTTEKRLWYGDLFSGQIDRIDHIGDEIAIVSDYKTGRISQGQAQENLQLRAYAVLVKTNLPKLKKIYVAIIQPMTDVPYTIAEYDENDLLSASSEILTIVTRAYSENAPRTPSPKACKYCRAKSVCPEAGGTMRNLAKNDSMSILSLTDEQLTEYNDAADIAESVIEAIRSETRRRLNAGAQIRGWELKRGRSSRLIDKPEQAYGILSEFLDPSEFAECCKVSVTSLEKAVTTKLQLKAKDGKEKLAELLGDVLITKQGEPMMSRSK
jgi:CRISPR/Cas system-associated exonuclease Cas4 (RecB family)